MLGADVVGLRQSRLRGAAGVFQLQLDTLELVVALAQLLLGRLQAIFGRRQLGRRHPERFLQVLFAEHELGFALLQLLGVRRELLPFARQLFPASAISLLLLGPRFGQSGFPEVSRCLRNGIGHGRGRGKCARILDPRAQ